MSMLRIAMIAVVLICALLLGLRMITIKIEPGETGVLNAEWTTGLIERDFGPGYHLDFGPLHTWTVFDTTVQTLHMTRSQSELVAGEVQGPLLVKSSDGATVTLDVTIKYQIVAGSAYRVFKQAGAGNRYKEQVRAQAVDVLSPALGRLQTDEFYNPVRRRETSSNIERDLTERLNKIHVKLIGVLIRDLVFEKAFEARIKEKTLAQQEAELNKAQTRASEERGRTQKIEAETEAKVLILHQEKEKTLMTMRAENDAKIAGIRAEWRKNTTQVKSDADLSAALLNADGVRLLKEAEAKGQTLKRTALANDGGQMLAALEAIRNLKFGHLAVSTQQMLPIDVDAMMRTLGVK